MAKRIFVAIPISESLQESILEWGKPWHTLPVRWLKGKNLHITLVPPWEEGDMDGAINKLKTAENFERFSVRLTDVNYGPDAVEPRLIWVSGIAPEKAVLLKEELEKTFDNVSDYRPWTMHLTLARFRSEDFRNFKIKELNEKVSWQEAVESVVLMESMKTVEGTDYQILATVNLKHQ